MLAFSVAGFLRSMRLQRLQAVLPLNPQGLGAHHRNCAFNTAISFVTNTNWQSYGGETTLSYLVQMLGLTVQNFVSAATGIALLVALIRGFARRSARTVGNFWVDLTRAVLYMLLPLSILVALVLVWQGVPQNLGAYTHAIGLEGVKQLIAQGPVASQEAIKMLGTNGGGFFNVNSAHPFENPTALSNFVEMWSILAISAALTYTFGHMVRDTRQGWAIFAVMALLFLAGIGPDLLVGRPRQSAVAAAHVAQAGNMEGKEVRFGVANSALWATATTDASNGSVNAMHDSFTPLGGMVPLVNIELGEIVFGGVGSGLYGMLLFAITRHVRGRTDGGAHAGISGQEDRGPGSEDGDAGHSDPAAVHPGLYPRWRRSAKAGLAGPLNTGPHGFSEILYAFTSATGNNGSAFAGMIREHAFLQSRPWASRC